MSNVRPHMERWEVIERHILVVIGVALLGFCVWLMFARTGSERFAWLALLAPCTYWVFWQALFEDKLKSGPPPSTAERAVWAAWIWSRRVALGAIAALFGAGAFRLLASNAIAPAAVLLFLAIVAGWVAAYGGGRHKSMSDDRQVHQKRLKRYE
jgi:hypothetical protein